MRQYRAIAAIAASCSFICSLSVAAQQADVDDNSADLELITLPANQAPEVEGGVKLDAITVTGSRIKKTSMEDANPVLSLSAKDLAAAGVTSIGDIMQRLSVSGSSLNTKFNSAGNFGFPADGGGVGSGSTTVSLRNLGAKRVLVLVDGLRWVNESSASGVSAAVDLNTIPFSAVERVEVLTDGASALYGSDAIAGVVNIITKTSQNDLGLNAYVADYSTGDGFTTTLNANYGGSGKRYRYFADVSYFDQNLISSDSFARAREPRPGTGLAFGSSATPFTRSLFFNDDDANGLCPATSEDGSSDFLCNITANGVAAGPNFVQEFPDGFHGFTNDDRYNYAPQNLLLTPSERLALFAQGQFDINGSMSAYLRVLGQNRESQNRAAPEPIFIGPEAGTGGLADSVGVAQDNAFNPFGIALDPEDNLLFAGRRPVEGGPRIFSQDVDTFYLAAGLSGDYYGFDRPLFWDLNLVSASNEATQTVQGTYNIANIQRALGSPADCTGDCVPLNFFGGPGTITPDMLNYIQFVEVDRSKQELQLISANVSGGLFDIPAGTLSFASGLEYRDVKGSYSPDPVVVRGESNGVPSLPTSGSYSVAEAYLELDIPVVNDLPGMRSLDVSLASRFSDYSTFGSTVNNKIGVRWEIFDELIARSTWAEGFRAPSVGELFGSPARFDAQLEDPCSEPQDQQTADNCASLGVPTTYTQANPQISVRTGGNPNLEAETAKSLTAGLVYSPNWASDQSWAQRLDFELTWYDIQVDDAVQAVDAQTQLDRCVATLDNAFCSGISRASTGGINGFDNTLLNLGKVDTAGLDLIIDWQGPQTAWGQFDANWSLTKVDQYRSISKATGLAEPRGKGIEVADSGIPEWRSTLRFDWQQGDISASWAIRYISKLVEQCGDVVDFASCGNPTAGTNTLSQTFYHDLRASWQVPGDQDISLTAGINNVLDNDPPVCVSCSLNGYDASVYDLPGQFAYLQIGLRY
ncbi:MAG: TonB-dependent receptor plug domain-containing protein [Oceanococcus sp.]